MSEFYTNVFSRGNKIFVRGYRDGSKFKEVIPFSPTLFVGKPQVHESEFKAFITDQPVEPIEFDTIRDARDFVKQYEHIDNFNIFGNTNYVNQYIGSKWTKEVVYDESKVDIMFIDIETETEFGFPNVKTANEKIQLITVKRKGKTPITFGYKPISGPPILNIEYRLHTDEESMLRSFVTYIKNSPPDVISGWNIDAFDIPYLCVRIFNLLGEDTMKQLSPFGFINMEEVEVMGRQELRFEICGISCVDYLPAYKKFVLEPRDGYKLDYIGEVEVGQKKLDHSEFATFRDFYLGDWHKFVDYNIKDVCLVEEIDKKRNVLSLMFSVAYIAKVNVNDVFSPIKIWESVIYNHLLQNKYAIPLKKHSISQPFEGAYVKDTLVGSYDWVVTFDLTSMYPHLIMMCNMSPETITGNSRHVLMDDLINKKFDSSEVKSLGYSLAGNGQLFDNSKDGVFPILMKYLFAKRDATKKEMIEIKKSGGSKQLISSLNTKQNAYKILLNALYGGMGNAYFKYYDLRIAEGITKTGQLAIRWIERKLNEKLNHILKTQNMDLVVASDTDSVMVNFGPVVDLLYKNKDKAKTVEFLDKICKEVMQPFIAESYKELAEYLNAKEAAMHMKRENLCVHPDTEIHINDDLIKIQDYYDSLNEICEPDVKVSYDMTKSYNTDKNIIEDDFVDFVSRKLCTERMFEIEMEDGTILKLTENHEVYVKVDSNKFMWVKAKDLTLKMECVHI